MPSTSQPSNPHPKSDNPGVAECDPFAAAAPIGAPADLPGVGERRGEQQHLRTAHLPLIRVPSSVTEVNSPSVATETALVSSRSNVLSSSGLGGGGFVTAYMPPFGSSSGKTGRQRRVSDASQAATPSLQAVLSLAAKVRPSVHVPAVLKTGQVCRTRVQPKARVKAGKGPRDGCLPATGKGTTVGDKGSVRQSNHMETPSCPRRYRFRTGLAVF